MAALQLQSCAFVTLFLMVIISSFMASFAVNPAFKTRITSHGLDYANDVAVKILEQKVENVKLPNQHGSTGSVTFDLKNMKITSFVKPKSSITLIPGSGLSWKANAMSIGLHGNYHYTYHKWIRISDGGSCDVTLTNMAFKIAIRVSSDSTGRPKIAESGCTSTVGKVNVKFHGGASWIYNMFSGRVGNMIKKKLTGQLCEIVKGAINKDAENALKRMPITVFIDNVFMLDYSLVTPPTFSTVAMETAHKGEVYWSNAITEAPFPAPVCPEYNSTDRMVYLWVSDYVFNTLGYVAQTHNVLSYNLTAEDLPIAQRGVLNTTCTSAICIGNLIPQIGKKYPHSQVELLMSSTRRPVMSSVNGVVKVDSGGEITMAVRIPNKSSVFLVSLNATMKTAVTLSVRNERICGQVKDLGITIAVVKSDIGDISQTVLQWIINSAIRVFVEPKLNDLGAKGVPLPVLDNIRFENTQVVVATDTLIISTDLRYQPPSDTVLRYKGGLKLAATPQRGFHKL